MATKRSRLPTAKAVQPPTAYALLPAFCRRHLPSGRRLRSKEVQRGRHHYHALLGIDASRQGGRTSQEASRQAARGTSAHAPQRRVRVVARHRPGAGCARGVDDGVRHLDAGLQQQGGNGLPTKAAAAAGVAAAKVQQPGRPPAPPSPVQTQSGHCRRHVAQPPGRPGQGASSQALSPTRSQVQHAAFSARAARMLAPPALPRGKVRRVDKALFRLTAQRRLQNTIAASGRREEHVTIDGKASELHHVAATATVRRGAVMRAADTVGQTHTPAVPLQMAPLRQCRISTCTRYSRCNGTYWSLPASAARRHSTPPAPRQPSPATPSSPPRLLRFAGLQCPLASLQMPGPSHRIHSVLVAVLAQEGKARQVAQPAAVALRQRRLQLCSLQPPHLERNGAMGKVGREAGDRQ